MTPKHDSDDVDQHRQVSLHSWSELRSLLEKDLISPTTLVWSRGGDVWCSLSDLSNVKTKAWRRGSWSKVPVGIAALASLISVIAAISIRVDSSIFPASLIATNEKSAPMARPSETRKTAQDPLTLSPKNTTVAFQAVPPSLPSQETRQTRQLLSDEDQLELRIWRSVARSGDVNLYKSYLRYYPAGTFAALATSKLNRLAERNRQASNHDAEQGKQKRRRGSPIHITRKITPTTTALRIASPNHSNRCWEGNRRGCR